MTPGLHDIERKLDRITLILESQEKKLEDQAKCSKAWRLRMTKLMWGNGERDGMVVRLDRLEQGADRSRWFSRMVLGGVLGSMIAAVTALVRR